MTRRYPIALKSVAMRTRLQGLYAETDIAQVYQNLEETNIEAVYTFPLPPHAVLLEVALELDGVVRRGRVQRKSEAEEQYEDAVEGGDAAVLLEQVEPGVFALNAGNLKSGEQATIRFRYGLLLEWNGDRLRLQIPTTLAPRYGDPGAAGWAHHQTPDAYALAPDFGFSCRVRIEGELARADFECPSHPVQLATRGDVRELSLSGESAPMDRDFVLTLRKPHDFSVHGLWAPDVQSQADGYVALVSLCPQSKAGAVARRCVKLVVDCSGSMGGPSIKQAKSALREILSLLNPDDEFEVIAFGSRVKSCFGKLVSARRASLDQAEKFVDGLNADMGGTETGSALDHAYHCARRAADVFLITDGQVHEYAGVIAKAKKSRHRVFSVGVGHAMAENFIQGLAQATCGAHERVSPREDMAGRIVRHFQRIDAPKVTSVRIEGGEDRILQGPVPVKTMHSGDTLHLFYWQDSPPGNGVVLEVTFEDGQTYREEISQWRRLGDTQGDQLDPLPRMAMHRDLSKCDAEEDAEDMAQLAVDYQLVSQYTSCVLVRERMAGEKADGQPKLRKVPQTLAEGWGGLGNVYSCNINPVAASDGRRRSAGSAAPRQSHVRDFIVAVNGLPARELENRLECWTIGEFSKLVDPDRALLVLLDRLMEIAAEDAEEKTVIVVFLALLSIKWSNRKFHADARAVIWDAFREAAPAPGLVGKVADLVGPDRGGLSEGRYGM